MCTFVCSGSEANELALRMARARTGQGDVVVLDGAYHGTSQALIEMSPYKYQGDGGFDRVEHVHQVPAPDLYRGPYREERDGTPEGEARGATRHAGDVRAALEGARAAGRGVAAFFCESALGCAGQIPLPEGYLRQVYPHVRDAGAVCVADEVQVGFGRAGSHFWTFETQGVTPDIVTLGKPMGNGHPVAAVVTTREIAEAFDNGMEYFNTFGGNPVSCAIGMAVLDVIEEEGLQAHAAQVGELLLQGLAGLAGRHALVGDVRGLGLFVGVELVTDRETLEPAADAAAQVVEELKERGILVSTDGPLHNVLKLKPPLVFSAADAERVVAELDEVLAQR